MTRLFVLASLTALVAGLLACGGDDTTGNDVSLVTPDISVDVPQDEDSSTSDTSERPDGEIGDTADVVEDIPVADTVVPDISQDVAPQPGEFGYPCTDNTQCDSNFCVESRNGSVCTKLCVENCPDEWSCKNVGVGGEPLYICVPLFVYLCDPCMAGEDCNSQFSGGAAVCIDKGQTGKFCGGDCNSNGYCPNGYACEQVEDSAGESTMQCIPEEGECQCSTRAIKLGLSTECFEMNDAGTCLGDRKCILSGLTECNAPTPDEEVCNGLDDDCNGLTDELQGKFECVKTNEFGTCKGVGDCINGSIANCDAMLPTSEACNGMDDDCDGSTDEGLCYDGNDCTQDICDPGSTECVFQPTAGPCDDLNPCTVNDYCGSEGNCLAGVQKNCDDGLVCTDDSCDPGTGNCIHTSNFAPCEDGDPCTINDKCANKICQPGQAKDCSDTNSCTLNEHCDSSTGQCVSTPNDGAPCDDDDVCSKGDVCSGGLCIGPKDYCDGQICTPTPPQVGCVAPKCLELFGIATCPCICL